MNTMSCFIIVDASKTWLDIAIRADDHVSRQTNTPTGIAALVEQLKAIRPELSLLEATGGLERPVAVALIESGLSVRIVDPARVRHFVRSLGQQAKTDALDARLLAQFADQVRPEAGILPVAELRELEAINPS